MQVAHNNYVLIIQGPILSSGRTGVTFNSDLTKDAIVDYECTNNILTIIEQFGNLFEKICIVTWEEEQLDETKFSKFNNCSILKYKNLTPNIIINNKNLPTDFNNKYKQFYLLSKGADFLKDERAEYIIKIRTDQYLNLDQLIKEHQSLINKTPSINERIIFPYIINNSFMISDFYFVAKKETFSNFVNAMLAGNFLEFNSSVHIDMSLKYAFYHCKEQLDIHDRTFFLNSFSKNINRDKIKLRNFLSQKVYFAFSSKIIDSLIWRGDKMTFPKTGINNYVFSENYSELLQDINTYKKTNIGDFIFVNIPAYLSAKYPSRKESVIFKWIIKLYNTLHKIIK